MKTTLCMVCLGLILFWAGCGSDDIKTYSLTPPLSGIEMVRETIEVDPTQTQVVRFKNGIRINLPAHAFVDQNNKIVSTPVRLWLENYDTEAKIIASGIPMRYFDGVQEHFLESAGMFYLQGFSAGKSIKISQDKTLTIFYPSEVQGAFDFFYLKKQKSKGAWEKLYTHPDHEIDTAAVHRETTFDFHKEITPKKDSAEHKLTMPDGKQVAWSQEGIEIYNVKDSIIASYDSAVSDVKYIKRNNLLCETYKGQLFVWNIEQDTATMSHPDDFEITHQKIGELDLSSSTEIIEYTPFIAINIATSTRANTLIWNYESNKTFELDFHLEFRHEKDSVFPEIVSGFNYEDGTFRCFNLQTQKELIKLPGYAAQNGEVNYFKPVKFRKSNRILVSSDKHVQLYSRSGRLVHDFKQYDSLIHIAGITPSNLILTLSRDSMSQTWDHEGNLISSQSTHDRLITRQFNITKFGIYNWDRVSTQENTVEFAANFNFSQTIDFQHITVFLVSELEGKSVIKFPISIWNHFLVDPTIDHTMIVVLSDNRISVFSKEDFRNVDWSAVKKIGKYTFNMTPGKKVEKLEDLDEFL